MTNTDLTSFLILACGVILIMSAGVTILLYFALQYADIINLTLSAS